MKYRLIALLLLGALLAGCVPHNTLPSTSAPSCAPTAPSTVPTVPTDPTETLPEMIPATLLDQAEAVGDSDRLLYVPSSHVESMALPSMQLFGNALLLHEYQPTADGGVLALQLIRLEDGALLAETKLSASGGCMVQTGKDAIMLYDSDLGRVTILDSTLGVTQTYDLPYGGNPWYPDQALQRMYIFVADRGLPALELETGEESRIIPQGVAFSVKGADATYVIFEYTDKTDLRTYICYLDLLTGSLETVPFTGSVSAAYRNGSTWLIRSPGLEGNYTVVTADSSGTLQWPDSQMQLLNPQAHLLLPQADYRGFSLYGTDGTFLSRCTLQDQEYACAGSDFIWSDFWKGYFFIDTWDNTAHLMFWDIRNDQSGDPLQITPPNNQTPPAHTVDPMYYQQALELSQRFGVDIRIAEQCMLDYGTYESIELRDDYSVSTALAALERCLSRYPEGMLEQLTFGSNAQLRIELVGTLRAKAGVATHPALAKGFVEQRADGYILVLDAFGINDSTIYHELSHVIDKRLEWYATIYPDAAFNEDAWLALQPEGFRYAYSYTNIPADILAYSDSGYFLRDYAMTFPTEDRATVMAAAMMLDDRFENSAAMQAKMAFYAQCIRESFRTDLWPETTAWERP